MLMFAYALQVGLEVDAKLLSVQIVNKDIVWLQSNALAIMDGLGVIVELHFMEEVV